MPPVLFEVVFQERLATFATRCRSDLIGGRTEWYELLPAKLQEFTEKLRNRGSHPTPREEQEQLGQELFGLLFQGSSRRLFDRARGEALGRGVPFLLRLCLEDHPVLAEVPWELMHDGFAFLAKDSRCSMVRALENGGPARSRKLRAPLRILLTSGIPRASESLDLEQERQAVEKARHKTPHIDRPVVRRHVSWSDLEELLTPGPGAFHIWLHCGHGDFMRSDPGRYSLLLKGNGSREVVPADRIDELAARCPDLTLVFLACCYGGDHNGLASQLARLQVPIVLGFPWEVGLPVSSQLAVTLLRGLGSLAPEVACSTARSALAAWAPDSLEWSHPLLFSRRSALKPLLAPAKPAPLPVRKPSSRRPARPQIRVDIEDVDVGGAASIIGASGPVAGDVSVRAKKIQTRGALSVRGQAAERRYRRELVDLLEDLESETREKTDA